MIGASGIDWDDAFDNASYIADAAGYPDKWASRAAAFRQQSETAELDLSFGSIARERLDLFRPDGAAAGLVVFVHGGFWQKFDKSYWSHLAKGALDNGWAVAIPNYTLAPDATLPEMVRQIARAVGWAASAVAGPIHLVGHSAGGHLVTRLICNPSPLKQVVQERIGRVVSISGLHDLRPLRLNRMNERLQLSEAMAVAESVALQVPLPRTKVTAWVGASERPEFLRQAALLVECWSHRGAVADLVLDSSRHHFDVIDGLREPTHPLTLALLRA